jgi:uncharacterized membrane protein
MPWWIVVYVIVFVSMGLGGLIISYLEKSSRWRLCCDALALAGISLLFVGYWHGETLRGFGLWPILVFGAALSWELCDLPREIRELQADAEMPKFGRYLWGIIVAILEIPIFVIAGMAAFNA